MQKIICVLAMTLLVAVASEPVENKPEIAGEQIRYSPAFFRTVYEEDSKYILESMLYENTYIRQTLLYVYISEQAYEHYAKTVRTVGTNSYKQTALGYAAFDKGDGEMALYWFNKAAEQGNAYAEDRLGEMYLLGWGVDKDREQAKYWFERSAQHGYVFAAFATAAIYADMKFNDKNMPLTKHKDISYFDGDHLYIGKNANLEKAAYWFNFAATGGYKPAKRILERYKKQFEPYLQKKE